MDLKKINNSTIDVLVNHTSIRKFNRQEISDEAVNTIVEAAKRGATAGNMMLYSIVKIRSKSALKSLSESCDDQPFIADASLALLFVLDHNKWQKYFEISGLPERIKGFSGPSISDFVLAMQDATIAAQNAVIAAESMGIGTCYIGDIMEQYEMHKALFNLPEYTMPAILVVFGHYDHKPVLRPRFENEFTVFEETYPEIDEAFIHKMFKAKDESTEDFAYKFYMRKKDADFFKEMNRSIHKYLSEWTGKEKRTD